MSSESLLRMEKKLDLLLEALTKLITSMPDAQKGGYSYKAPMHQLQQLCPACSEIIIFERAGEDVNRKCGCKPPSV